MSLSVGIVGLPNAGKSTLFNALVARRLSPTAVHPFTTIEPHEAVVPVPDGRLAALAELVKNDESEIIPATVTFIDIAGLVKGANEGAGLGNQFLAKIREVDTIIHVVRSFEDPNVAHVHHSAVLGTSEQIKEDIEVVNLELELAGIKKPTIYVVNVDGKQLGEGELWDVGRVMGVSSLVICAKLEEELSDLRLGERKQYLNELSVEESGVEKLIQAAYKILDLITFYTIKGGEEVHAWSIKQGSTALSAAERVHTDFAKNFIKAEVINVDELLLLGGWSKAKESGKIKLEGKDYILRDGDVVEFKTGA